MRRISFALMTLCALASLCFTQSASAQYNWNVADGNFANQDNWSPVGVPSAADAAYINNGGTSTINSFTEVGSIDVASDPGSTGELLLSEGADVYTYAGDVRFGEEGTATGTINNGRLDITSGKSLFIGGQNSTGTGTLTITGSKSYVQAADDFIVGRLGTGTLNFQGGLAKGGYTVVAKYGTAVWNHTGGVYDQNFGDFEIGDGGRPDQLDPGPRIGTINLSGGVIQGAGYFAIGNRRGTGIVNISGGVLAINNVGDGTILVGRGLDSGDIIGQGGPTSLRVTGDDAIVIANGNFDMNSSGVASSSTLIAEITGATHTTIKVGGDALLANGTLAVDLTGYVPNVGDSWTILQAGVDIINAPEIAQIDAIVAASLDPSLGHVMAHTPQNFQGTLQGTFANVDYSQATLPAGRGWEISYADNSVVLSVVSTGPAFSADFNNDGKVDGGDLTTWKQSFGGVGADANGDGVSNGADFLMWQQQFGSGVTATSAVGAVPEPASIALFGLATMAMAAYGRSRRHRA